MTEFAMSVFVRFTFEGFHRWPGAPDEVFFLSERHRHVFHVEAKARVSHENRDLEFILLKRSLVAWCEQKARREVDEYNGVVPVVDGVGNWSCETWGKELLIAFPSLYEVSVSEDGENGAIVTAGPR